MQKADKPPILRTTQSIVQPHTRAADVIRNHQKSQTTRNRKEKGRGAQSLKPKRPQSFSELGFGVADQQLDVLAAESAACCLKRAKRTGLFGSDRVVLLLWLRFD